MSHHVLMDVHKFSVRRFGEIPSLSAFLSRHYHMLHISLAYVTNSVPYLAVTRIESEKPVLLPNFVGRNQMQAAQARRRD